MTKMTRVAGKRKMTKKLMRRKRCEGGVNLFPFEISKVIVREVASV